MHRTQSNNSHWVSTWDLRSSMSEGCWDFPVAPTYVIDMLANKQWERLFDLGFVNNLRQHIVMKDFPRLVQWSNQLFVHRLHLWIERNRLSNELNFESTDKHQSRWAMHCKNTCYLSSIKPVRTIDDFQRFRRTHACDVTIRVHIQRTTWI